MRKARLGAAYRGPQQEVGEKFGLEPDFDRSRAMLGQPDTFQRFRVEGPGELLVDAGLEASTEVLLIERKGHRLAFLMSDLDYHHLAQGELAGEPYVVAF